MCVQCTVVSSSSNREALNFVPGISRQQTTVRTKAHSVCGQLL